MQSAMKMHKCMAATHYRRQGVIELLMLLGDCCDDDVVDAKKKTENMLILATHANRERVDVGQSSEKNAHKIE